MQGDREGQQGLYLCVVRFVQVHVGDGEEAGTPNQQTEECHEPVRVPAPTSSHVGVVC